MLETQAATTGYGPAIAAVIFYALVIISLFFSISTIYSLNKYGKTRSVTLAVSLAYSAAYLVLVAQGINILNAIK